MITRNLKFKCALLASSLFLSRQVIATTLVSGIDQHHFDKTVRIQDDLYHAVNGNWIRNAIIPSDKASIGVFTQLIDLNQLRTRDIIRSALRYPKHSAENCKMGNLYKSFMDEKTIEAKGLSPIKNDLHTIAKLHDRRALTQYLGQLQGTVVNVPIGLYVSLDKKDSSVYLAHVGQAGLGMPDRDYYLKQDRRFEEMRHAYIAYLTRLFTLGGYSAATTRAQKVFDLEYQLATLHWDTVENRHPEKTYNKLSLTELSKLAPGIDWTVFLHAAQAKGIHTLNIDQPSYVSSFATLFQHTPLSSWQDYLRAHTLDAYSPYLNKAAAKSRFEFYGKTLSGTTEMRPRWQRAVSLVDASLGDAIGQQYVKKYFPLHAKARMGKLVDNLMKAYSQSIDSLPWMGEETRQAAQAKLAKYNLQIGYPSKWKNYASLTIYANDLVGNVKRSSQFDYRTWLDKIGKPVDRGEWRSTPQTVNAYYTPLLNEITFPAAILQPPFFNLSAEDAVNYGAIGSVIGHEISHGFDDMGSQFDGDGNLKNWWTNEDKTRFKALTTKLVTQYSSYEPLPGQYINGQLTLGENIADNAGLQIAYKAYQLSLQGAASATIDGLSGEQRFFIGFSQIWRSKIRDEALLERIVTDPHAPAPFRVIGAAINSDAFHKAFNVQPGDKMFKPAEERIRLW